MLRGPLGVETPTAYPGRFPTLKIPRKEREPSRDRGHHCLPGSLGLPVFLPPPRPRVRTGQLGRDRLERGQISALGEKDYG